MPLEEIMKQVEEIEKMPFIPDWAAKCVGVFPTIREFKNDYDWKEAFQVSGADIDQVEKVIASAEGVNDGDNWEGIFKMKNGKYIFLSAGCDYTGWDCRAGGNFIEKETLNDVLSQLTLGQETRERLRDQLKDYEKDWS